jgi:hypothetical protein
MNEDEITNALIRYHKDREKKEISHGDTDAEVEIYPEEHYNHYGDRGVVDLYVVTGGWDGHLFEIKSESAVRNATGANEIIRQFNRMRQHFFPGSNHSVPSWLSFELCFTPTEFNARHLIENADMYSQCVNNEPSQLGVDRFNINICFRLPDSDNITPVHAFTRRLDYDIGTENFVNHAEASNPDIYERIKLAPD